MKENNASGAKTKEFQEEGIKGSCRYRELGEIWLNLLIPELGEKEMYRFSSQSV